MFSQKLSIISDGHSEAVFNFLVHLLAFFAFSFVLNSTENAFTFSLRSLRFRSPQERGGRGSQSHFFALNGSPERGHRRDRGKYAIILTPFYS